MIDPNLTFEPGCECTWYDGEGEYRPECPVHGEQREKPFLELRNLNADDGERYAAYRALTCDYYNGWGGCGGGCYEEPSCRTDEPLGGWEWPTPYGLHVLEEVAERAKVEREREEFERWLLAEQRWLQRPILESRHWSMYGGIPRDIPNGVYPVNPLALERQEEPKPWIALHNTSGGGSMSYHATREEAEEELLSSEASTRNFWEEKVEWRENGDKTTPSYWTMHGSLKPKLRAPGGQQVLRIGHWHYVPRRIYEDGKLPERGHGQREHMGFGGRVFRWRYLDEDGEPTGPIWTSDDVYTQGEIPEEFRDRLPDNAVFVYTKPRDVLATIMTQDGF
ncbi:hypothetical protein SEA_REDWATTLEHOG_152 [Gordonia phage RedWattleHog]|uniref:Uncharacterized protein n=1 Tax=Gordonia phage Stormageddon TaxID=2656541 RepID=A0A649VTX9_9CAUD|nr:hypothetical protein KHQ86_gp147 [Gordonia phage Stormageddon]QGJ95013.1 hypothetical protein SEA_STORMAGEDDON_153 [Gordonia phage Stormageddon]QLF83655.1 hypothetical protein SEA_REDWATTLEHOG_152 [Gordonia phage RedWattleHog]